jgi:hypothetical protein
VRQVEGVVVAAALEEHLTQRRLGPGDAVLALGVAQGPLAHLAPGLRPEEPVRSPGDLLHLPRRPVRVQPAVAGIIPHPEPAGVVQDRAVEVGRQVVGSAALRWTGGEHRLLTHGGLAQVQADVAAQGQRDVVDGQQHVAHGPTPSFGSGGVPG